MSVCDTDYEKGKLGMQALLRQMAVDAVATAAPVNNTPPLPPPIVAYDSDIVEDSTLEQTLHLIINDIREKAGLRRLDYDFRLAATAEEHSVDMYVNKFFSHVNLKGERVGTRAKNTGYRFQLIGENIHRFYNSRFGYMHKEDIIDVILYGFKTDPSKGWMNSPGHKSNILNSNYTHQGLGIHITNNNCYTTQVLAVPANPM